MPSFFIANALVPAFCEEAIRSSYLFYLGDRGSRRNVVLSIGAVFVVGELIYDTVLLPGAIEELGFSIAFPIFIFAVFTGGLLHLGLTAWTAHRQASGVGAWRIFIMALMFHGTFNLGAIGAVERFL